MEINIQIYLDNTVNCVRKEENMERTDMKQKIKDMVMALVFYCALLAGPAVAVLGAK